MKIAPVLGSHDIVLMMAYGEVTYTQRIDAGKTMELFVATIQNAVNEMLEKVKTKKLKGKKDGKIIDATERFTNPANTKGCSKTESTGSNAAA